jgi:hypothetical protein
MDGLERFDNYYMKGPGGTLHFNGPGRARLAPWFASHGFALQSCKTEDQFKEVLRLVLAADLVQAQAQLQSMLDSGNCTETERQVLQALLHKSPDLTRPDPDAE